jgi:hypothetical protein
VTAFAYDPNAANEATGFSGFGGHLLFEGDGIARAVIAEAAPETADQLAALGVTDAEQLLAMAVVPGMRDELEAALGTGVVTLLDQVGQALPPERAQLVGAPAPRDLGLGVLPPTEAMLAAAEASAMQPVGLDVEAVALPAAVNLIPFFGPAIPIRNQASRGTCVAFTLTALNEYILRRRGLLRNLTTRSSSSMGPPAHAGAGS